MLNSDSSPIQALNKCEPLVLKSQKEKLELAADCEKCFGLCCVALYFFASEDFPRDKESGRSCDHLQRDYRCGIHNGLRENGYKGCTVYDCFGAGQKVCQNSFQGESWREKPESAEKMFTVFLIMKQLHEFLWYLTLSTTYQEAHPIHDAILAIRDETLRMSLLGPNELLQINISNHRLKVKELVNKASELIRFAVQKGLKAKDGSRKLLKKGPDFMGADLREIDLKGANLKGAFLIAANLRGKDLSWADLIGADLRDADIGGADLSRSLFLTQTQVNSARGDAFTKLPPFLVRPSHWK